MSGQLSLLGKKRFLPFFITQILGAFTDNVFKNAITLLIVFKLASEQSAMFVNIAAGLFVLPFFMFSSIAGQIAEKMEKSKLIRYCKLAEIFIMAFGAYSLYLNDVYLLLFTLFLMGSQSTIFGPAKYSILPQHLKESELVGGNGLVEMGTFLAILLGTMTGAYFISKENGEFLVSCILLGSSMIGLMTSLFIPKAESSEPDLKVSFNIFTGTKRLFTILNENPRSVKLSVLGVSWFWFLGATYLSQIPEYVKTIDADETVVTLFLAVFSIGIAIGSVLCEVLSRKKIELGIVPIGSIGLSVFGFLLASTPLQEFPLILDCMNPCVMPAYDWLMFLGTSNGITVCLSLFFIGVFGGLYTVPLYALIQKRSNANQRSRVIASNNMFNALFMVCSALIAILFYSFGMSVVDIFMFAAVVNSLVAIYIYYQVPEFFIRFVMWMISHTLYRVSHKNIDNLPEDGACVIVSNHVSYFDALVLAGAFKRPVRFVMYEPIFRIPVLNKFFKAARAIPITSRYENEKIFNDSFVEISKALDNGEVVCIFPEGKLTADGEMNEFKGGIEQIIKNNPVSVLPCAINGLWGSVFSRKPKANLPRLKWSRLDVNVGDLVPAQNATKDNLFNIVSNLRNNIR